MMNKDDIIARIKQVCNICIFSVHSCLISKYNQKLQGFQTPRISAQSMKTMNIKMSSRKLVLLENDFLIKLDILAIFKESLTVI